MRPLSATLTANQKLGGVGLYKVVLTKSGEDTLTYGIDTANRIKDIKHDEQEWNQTAQVIVDNSDGTLTDLDIWGYKGVISLGFNDPTQGDEYSACAPLYVIGQHTITKFYPEPADFSTVLSLAGVFNLMGEDHASVAYEPDKLNTDTVKTIMTAIAEATLTCFDHCKAWTITFDSEDSLIDSFKPADAFRIGFNESRLAAFKRVISYTKCKARIEDDGEIHIYSPTVSGNTWAADTAYVLNDYVQPSTPNNNFTYRCTTAGTSDSSEPTWPTTAGGTVNDNTVVWTAVAFDYEYNDADALTNHWFYGKGVRKRVVIPGKVVVSTHPDDEGTAYTGSAQDADYTNNPVELRIPEYIYIRAISDAQCDAIAAARLQRHQLRAEKGHGKIPMNCGAEVLDYVKITDSAAGDIRIGNRGYISRHCAPGVFDMDFGFGTLELLGLAGTIPPSQQLIPSAEGQQSLFDTVEELIERFNSLAASYNELLGWLLQSLIDIDILTDLVTKEKDHLEIKSLSVTLRNQIPQGPNMYT